MRLAFWKKDPSAPPSAGPTPWDRWLFWTRVGALVGAAALLLVSVVPTASDWSAPNAGGDVNITVEFYTAFERGGGFITWDIAGASANVLRGRIDADRNGVVADHEVRNYGGSIETALEQEILVLRNFELRGSRLEGQGGLVGEPVNSSTPAHVLFQFSGQWAQRDQDIQLGGDRLATLGMAGNLTPGAVVHERTIMIEGGFATFHGISGNVHVMRVPAGIVVVSTGTWREGTSSLPNVHFSLFSPAENSLLLLIPLGIALVIGVGGARRERDATGQPRVVRFHQALSALFLLLIVAYFAAAPGPLIWAGGAVLGLGGLMLAYRIYPADRRPGDWAPPKREEPEPTDAGWVPVVDNEAGEPAALPLADLPPLVDAAPAAEVPREPAVGPDGTETQEAPDRGTRPKIIVSSMPRPTPEPAAAEPEPEPDPQTAPKKIRCPGCKMMFEAAGRRPLHVTCPHCGRRGVLR